MSRPRETTNLCAPSRQFVRKVSGFSKPSQANQAAIDQAVNEISQTIATLFAELVTTAEPRDRAIEAEKARQRSAVRFGTTRS